MRLLSRSISSIFVALLILSLNVVKAQSISYYGYSAHDMETATEAFVEPQWALTGVKGSYQHSKFPGKLVGHFEYDLLNDRHTRAHGLYRLSTSESSSVSLVVGQYLSPTAFLHPSGKWIRAPRRAATIAGSQIAPTGVASWFSWETGVARLSVANNGGDKAVTGAFSYRGFSAFRSTGGYGLMVDKHLSKWANFWVGAINHNASVPRDYGGFIQHYFEFGNVRLYTQVDVFREGDEIDSSWFAGASVKLRKYWDVGAFYKQGADGGSQAVLRVSFHLGN